MLDILLMPPPVVYPDRPPLACIPMRRAAFWISPQPRKGSLLGRSGVAIIWWGLVGVYVGQAPEGVLVPLPHAW